MALNRTYGLALTLPTGVPVPGATVAIYQIGTVSPVTLYADGAATQPLANPFVANALGYWDCYFALQRVDVRISGSGVVTPYTLGDYVTLAGEVQSLAYASFPASTPTTAGTLLRRTDGPRGLWMDGGVGWFGINGTVINVQEFGATGNGVTDDTAAILAAVAQGKAASVPVWIPEGIYNLSASLVYTGTELEWLAGPGILRNRCAAGNPAILVRDGAYKYFKQFGVIGDILYPNDAIQCKSSIAGTLGVYNCDFEDLFLCPNGNGIHLSDSDILNILNLKYLPSGQNRGATATQALCQNAVIADGIGSVNLVTIDRLNTSSYASTALGGAAIKWNAAQSEGITISNCELEGELKTGIDLTNVFSFNLFNVFLEGAAVNLKACEYGRVNVWGAAKTVITLGDGTAPNGCFAVLIVDTIAKTFNADSHNDRCGAINSNFAAGNYNNSSADPVTISVSGLAGGSTQVRDQFYVPWTSAAFAAGNFTSSSGTWGVGAGDQRTFDYSILDHTLSLLVWILNSTITGTPATLRVTLPESRTVGRSFRTTGLVMNNAGTQVACVIEGINGDAFVSIYPSVTGGGTFAAGADNNDIQFSLTCRLT